ncbi:FAD-binding domain-containing protein [Mycena floridula]|nr:FAD-binding domain-containing protein [Mycena floridula]
MKMFGGTALAMLISASTVTGYSLVAPEKWLALNATVQGRLSHGIPFARPCFQQAAPGTLGNFSAEGCATVTESYLDRLTLADNFGAYFNTQWETCQRTGAECLLDWTNPNNSAADTPPRVCSQGSIPQFAINVTTAADVIAAFKFSKATGVPVMVKNTGHDYKGRSSAPGTLALWVHGLKSIQLKNNFIPQNCPKTTVGRNAVALGAGVQFTDLLTFAEENKVTIPTGGCPSVGAAGGYPQGGGHSSSIHAYFILSQWKKLEYEVVTPEGQHIIANECSHPDLFFALSGGGGGTFGVVLKVTTLVFPKMLINAVVASYDDSNKTNRLHFLQFMTNHAVEMAQQGWGSYILGNNVVLANPTLTPTAANASMIALRKFITGIGGSFTATVEPSYTTFFNKYIGVTTVFEGTPTTLSSRLIPVENFKTSAQRDALSSTLDGFLDKFENVWLFGVTPFFYGENNKTSVTPAWRNSIWHAILISHWNFNSSVSEVSSIYSDLTAGADVLRAMTPGSGAYQNEADVYEPDHEASFWGDNYPRLLAIKKKYDPDHLLDVWHGVGWRGAQDSRYQCYI